MGRCCYVVVMLLRKKEDGLECWIGEVDLLRIFYSIR